MADAVASDLRVRAVGRRKKFSNASSRNCRSRRRCSGPITSSGPRPAWTFMHSRLIELFRPCGERALPSPPLLAQLKIAAVRRFL